QGTSGWVFVDPASNGDHGTIFTTSNGALTSEGDSGPDGPFQGVGTFAGLSPGLGHPVTFGGVGNTLEAGIQHGGENGGWGNDILNGGAGANGVENVEVGGLAGVGVAYDGNNGDNFFPEGGVDTVNIGGLNSSGAAIGASNATVWFGMYDVSNSGDHDGVLNDSGVGQVYGQAITDIVGGSEVYVDGYGPGTAASGGGVSGSTTSLLTINGFVAQSGVPSSGENSGDV